MNQAIKLLRNSPTARWIVLMCLAVPMFGSYFFDDMFSTIGHIFNNPQILDLSWDSSDYGMYCGAYSLLCVWGGLVICGMLLDKWGVRFTGSLFVGLMVAGSIVVVYAISDKFPGTALYNFIGKMFDKPSLALAYVGCSIFGLGSEIAGVAVTRSIAKWFKGKEMALAMGLQLALARMGTATAFILVPRIVNINQSFIPFSETSKPSIVGLILMLIAVILWIVFLIFDSKLDAQTAEEAKRDHVKPVADDKFKFSDIFRVLGNKYFILISLLCVFFYCCIISFKKFATSIVIPRFDIDNDIASIMVAMIPFFTMVFTPLFGTLVDRKGKATRFMMLGALLVLAAHLIIAFAPGLPFFGYMGIGILGIGYSLVPAAMWPSVPKVIPEKNLGTAYSLIYWIQNMGMLLVPMLVGHIIKITRADAVDPVAAELNSAVNAEYVFIVLGIVAISVAFVLAKLSDKNPQMMLDVPNKQK